MKLKLSKNLDTHKNIKLLLINKLKRYVSKTFCKYYITILVNFDLIWK